MSGDVADAQQLSEKASQTPYGYAKTALLERAVQLADAAQDLDLAFSLREQLAGAATHGGEPQKVLLAVTWCLGQSDRHPGRFDIDGLMWQLKWLPTSLVGLPQVSLAQLDEVIDDLARRYRDAGHGEQPVLKLRWSTARAVGDLEAAQRYYEQWRVTPRGRMSDCRACDLSEEVRQHLVTGREAKAFAVAAPLLAGSASCAEQPAVVLGELLEAALRIVGRTEADRLHVWGLRLAQGNPSLLHARAQHLAHLLRTRGPVAALRMAEDVARAAHRAVAPEARMHAEAAVSATFAAFATQGTPVVAALLPKDAPGDDDARPAVEVAAFYAERARTTAASFDARNGNDSMSRDLERELAIQAPAAETSTLELPSAESPDGWLPSVGSGSTPAPTTDALPLAELLRQSRQRNRPDEECLALATRVRDEAVATGDDALAAQAFRTLGWLLVQSGDAVAGTEMVQRAYEALTLLWPADPAVLGLERVRAALMLADLEDPTQDWQAVAAKIAGELPGDAEPGTPHATALGEFVIRQARLVPPQEAAPLWAQALALLAGTPRRLADCLAQQAWQLAVHGDLDSARALAERAVEVATDNGEADVAEQHGEVLARLCADTGELGRAIGVLAAIRDQQRARGALAAAAATSSWRRRLLHEAERPQEALVAAHDAVDDYDAIGDREGATWARLDVARTMRVLGHDQDAYDLLTDALEVAALWELPPRVVGAAAFEAAKLDADYEEDDDALELADRARLLLAQAREDGSGGSRDLAMVDRLLAELHLRDDRFDDGLAAAVQARDGFLAGEALHDALGVVLGVVAALRGSDRAPEAEVWLAGANDIVAAARAIGADPDSADGPSLELLEHRERLEAELRERLDTAR